MMSELLKGLGYEHNYRRLVKDILEHGEETTDRTGTGTRELLGEKFVVPAAPDRFPMLTGRQLYPAGVIGELASFLEGAETEQQFRDNGCNYWKAWADESGNLGPIYGAQWLYKNQLREAVHLLREKPDTRQAIINAWNADQLPEMCLPPCHFAFQLLLRKRVLHVVVYQRSLDVMVGLPSDVILYALLQRIICEQEGYGIGSLTFMVGSAHIYANHYDGAKEYLKRGIYSPPGWSLNPEASLQNFRPHDFQVINYRHYEPLRFELNV
jgi:thymidylate synthase